MRWQLVRNLNAKAFSLRRFATQTSSSSSEVLLERLSGKNEGVAVLALNRPAARNAISRSLLEATEDVVQTLQRDTSLRVLLLRSLVPGVFCAGADLKERATMSERDVGPFVKRLRDAATALASIPVPTIAALDGAALGGGLEFALACDLRIASSSAKMGLVETKLAIIPGAGGTQRLARVVGLGRAKEMILTARVLDGNQAYDWGLVNEVVDQNEKGDAAFHAALNLAGRMAKQAGPLALRLAKTALERGCELPLASGLAFEEACYAQVLPTADRVEALKAFREKRDPMYKGE
ncbi:methylglutaconyl-CoA hydratase, mitochondrial-like [Ornithodoros turicata]|uniref:methylglutaconyl-CoA hydratase, mitochondrial-like n=1 Tax=Ornithodoros turicata TaxID=34597 RepID=UPI003138CBD0